jgi:pyruvate dehydrogenase E2 component (dihydrolipoamide acetyltransferase)
MRYEFILPDIGEGVVEGEVVRWLVREGDEVALDQVLVEVMTDKATVQIPSPKQGRVLELLVAEGAMAEVGKPLLALEVSGNGEEASRPKAPSHKEGARPKEVAKQVPGTLPAQAVGGRALASPATRRLARELGVDLQGVQGTGPEGRVTKEDVHRAAQGLATSSMAAPRGPISVPSSAVAGEGGGPAEERIPVRGLRRLIADKMQRSKNTAAHFTYVDEVDMTDLVAFRERARRAAEERGVKLTFLPFMAKAVVAALRRFPLLNATLDEDRREIVCKRYYHLGIATATEAGLTVPVVHDVDRKSLFEIGREIEELAVKAREGRLAKDEVTGSTFTLTSLGKLGGLFATPILNYPEVAILGIHEIRPRPVVRDGQVVVREVMLISLSVDHRVVDGHVAAAFAQAVKAYLEDPTLLFLELV